MDRSSVYTQKNHEFTPMKSFSILFLLIWNFKFLIVSLRQTLDVLGTTWKSETRQLSLGSHINTNGFRFPTDFQQIQRSSFPPPPKPSTRRGKWKEAWRQVSQAKTPQGFEPCPGIRSANHQHLLLFFFKLGKGQKAKPEKTKLLFSQEKKNL